MNVFSTIDNPGVPVPLTQEGYNKKTSRAAPYILHDGEEIKSFALCPACRNPTLLVNRLVPTTNAEVLYAKHAGYSVNGLANHNQVAYKECPFHNPDKFDSKSRRTSTERNDEIRMALLNHIHLVVKEIEKATGITLSDSVVESMLKHFGGNQGHQYKAITLYNLPFGFAYMTEAQDLYGCRVENTIAQQINEQSTGFEVRGFQTVYRKKGSSGSELSFYFNNHRLGEGISGKDSIDLVIVEIERASNTTTTIFQKTLEFDSAYFFNTYMRRERLRLLALKHL
ncbi:hypothetical protein [Pseudomonas viridiflava]|uniref:hypothetical protein n=1 Tax=Pseudomonas viridiflava TaxID=33069 RepID=UPI001F120259|nr:hypothetical protein [Pseudomonas viridiflava]